MRRCQTRLPTWTLALLGALALAACQPRGAAPAATPSPVAPPTPAAIAAPLANAASAAAASDALAIAAAPTAEVAAAAAATELAAAATPETSVAIYIDAGTASPAEGPQAGKPIAITVTPVDGGGRPLKARTPILGAELLLVAARYDLTWVQALGTAKLSEPGGLSHRFTLTIPKSGRHILYFLVQPPGGPLSVTPVDLSVRGPALPGELWGEDETRVAGPKGMSIELRNDPEAFSVCQRSHIATRWVAKGKPVALQGAAGQPKVLYLAVPQSLTTPVLGNAVVVGDGTDAAAEASASSAPSSGGESVAAIGGDPGSDAWITLKEQGKHRIIAVAQLPAERSGDKQPALSAAVFAVTAGGKRPEGGCP